MKTTFSKNKMKPLLPMFGLTLMFLLAYYYFGNQESEPVKQTTRVEDSRRVEDSSPEMQAKRFLFIEDLKNENIIYKVEVPAKYPHVYVAPRFYVLNIDEKKILISVIAAYYLAKNREQNIVVLYDSRSGKNIGRFDKYGLHLK